jgi:hypothetical protein
MSSWTRRNILGSAAALSALPLLAEGKPKKLRARAVSGAPKPLIHVTDLFRPHGDPDDHWDLATGYALAWRDKLDLLGILTDNPENLPSVYSKRGCNPDVAAVAQLNYLTDRAVPVTTGTIWPIKPGEKVREDNLPKEFRGVNMLLDILERSSQPVAILIAGSSQDVAIAGKKEPKLFADKCAGIYLNAGSGSPNPKEQSRDGNVEWNVSLNRGAYATIFELACPIYWMPCFDDFSKTSDSPKADEIAGEYGTFWSFRQKEVLPYLSDRVQAFFACMLNEESGTHWLSYLLDTASKNATQKYLDDERGMWCTAGFLHVAGKTVTLDGQIASLDAAEETAAYEFVPIEVRCDANGITEWRKAEKPTNRYIFRVRDKDKYAGAMIKALKTMLLELP